MNILKKLGGAYYMKSRDNCINNPTETKFIDARNLFDDSRNVEYISQEMYEIMNHHDPDTVYIIKDSIEDDMYLGDYKIPKPAHSRNYLLSFSDHRKMYTIYLNLVSRFRDNLVPVAEYEDVNDALAALHAFKSVGYHTKTAYALYQSLQNYINGIYGINEAITGMIAVYGYRDDPRFQYLMETAISYGVANDTRDLPQYYRAALHNLKDMKPDSIIVIYSDIYDVFVKYNFFKDVDTTDLSMQINDIMNVFDKYAFM